MSKTKIQIRFSDIDVMGHVNNAIYLNYFEQARMEFFSQFIPKDWDWYKNGLLLAKNEVEYFFPVRLNDEIYIETNCTKIGNKSFELEYSLFKGDKLCCKGKSTLVCYDYNAKETINIPNEWLVHLNTLKAV